MVSEQGYSRITDGSTLTSGDVVYLLNVHINTIRKWQDERLLPGYRVGPRGDRMFRLEDIERFITNGMAQVPL